MFEDRGTRCVRLICVPDILDCGGAKALTDEPEMLSSNVKSSVGCDGVILIMPIASVVSMPIRRLVGWLLVNCE